MKKKSHYQLLDVPATATVEEIKKAFRAQAKVHHPDHNPGDAMSAERFRAINEAYEVLSDPARRAAYDSVLREQTLRDIKDMLKERAAKRAAPSAPVAHAYESVRRVVPPVAPNAVPARTASPPLQVRPVSSPSVGGVVAVGFAAVALAAILGVALGGSSGQARGPDGRFI